MAKELTMFLVMKGKQIFFNKSYNEVKNDQVNEHMGAYWIWCGGVAVNWPL